jgi:ABC-type antimicrobial peptide transport system permease subunit
LAADLPVADVRLLTTQMDDLYRPWRLGAAMFAVMGAVALAIVLVGLYSVLGYEVTERRKEFGIRAALGADAGTIIGLVVGQGLRTVGAALALGVLVALLAGSWVGRFLFQTSPRDPLVLGGAAAVMIAAAAIGALLPARRAARADPAETLRAD